MKKIILIGSTLIVLGLMAAWTIPALAGDGTTTSANDKAYKDMYKACRDGDYCGGSCQAGASEDYDNMPCHEDYNGTSEENGKKPRESWRKMGSHMGGGMMGGGMMG